MFINRNVNKVDLNLFVKLVKIFQGFRVWPESFDTKKIELCLQTMLRLSTFILSEKRILYISSKSAESINWKIDLKLSTIN